jgi:hypothetical protein
MAEFNKIYTVSINPDKYLFLQETLIEQTLQATEEPSYLFDGRSKADTWSTQGIEWLIDPQDQNLSLQKPDIAGLGATVFCVPEKVAELLKSKLESGCEFLPMNLNGEPWFALNIVGSEDAINEDLTEWNMRKGKVSRIRRFNKLVLNNKSINNNGVFRVERAGLLTFTTDAEGSLFSIAKQYNLTGLIFNEVESV